MHGDRFPLNGAVPQAQRTLTLGSVSLLTLPVAATVKLSQTHVTQMITLLKIYAFLVFVHLLRHPTLILLPLPRRHQIRHMQYHYNPSVSV